MVNDHYKIWKTGKGKYNKRQVAILKTWEAFLEDTDPRNRTTFFDVARLLESVWDFSED
jgi:hypothetical protein